MKKILSLAVLLSGISFATLAQEAPKTGKTDMKKEVRGDRKDSDRKDKVQQTPEEFAKSRTERLDKKVKLSEKQRKEVQALYLQEGKAGKPASKEEGAKRRELSREKLNKILTPEQQKLVSEKGKDHSKRGDHKDHGKKDKSSKG